MAARGNSFKERSTCHTDILCEKKRLDEGTSFLVYSASEAVSVHTQICNSDILETENKQEHWDSQGEMYCWTTSLLDPRVVPVTNCMKRSFYVSLQLYLLPVKMEVNRSL